MEARVSVCVRQAAPLVPDRLNALQIPARNLRQRTLKAFIRHQLLPACTCFNTPVSIEVSWVRLSGEFGKDRADLAVFPINFTSFFHGNLRKIFMLTLKSDFRTQVPPLDANICLPVLLGFFRHGQYQQLRNKPAHNNENVGITARPR